MCAEFFGNYEPRVVIDNLLQERAMLPYKNLTKFESQFFLKVQTMGIPVISFKFCNRYVPEFQV